MDAVLDVLLVLSLAGVFAYAFAVYEALKIMCAWAKARWRDEWGKRPLILKLPPWALTAVLVLCFLAVALRRPTFSRPTRWRGSSNGPPPSSGPFRLDSCWLCS